MRVLPVVMRLRLLCSPVRINLEKAFVEKILSCKKNDQRDDTEDTEIDDEQNDCRLDDRQFRGKGLPCLEQ